MRRGWLFAFGLLAAAGVAAIIALSAVLTPQQANPAYAAAVAFIDAAGRGDEAAAFDLLDERMRSFARERCPGGAVSACIDAYIPQEWGAFQNVVFRRAAPDTTSTRDGAVTAYDVEMIATYAQGRGFSGVCIYARMEEDPARGWRVAGYAGFVSCGDAESRNMATSPEAPNRAP